MMLHELLDHGLHWLACNVDFFDAGMIVRRRGADVGLLGGIEFLVHDDAVLEVIHAQVGSFRETYGAQMPGDFDAAGVSRFDRRAELRTRYMHVGLEGSNALVDPVVHKPNGVVGVFELVELRCERPSALEIRSGDMHLWTGNLSRVDQFFQSEVGVGFQATSSSQGGDAAGEIQARKTEPHFAIESGRAGYWSLPGRGRIEKVVVHADETGNDRTACEVHRARTGGA